MAPRKSTDATGKKRGRPSQAEASDSEGSGSDASVESPPARAKKGAAATKKAAPKKSKGKNAPAANDEDEEEVQDEEEEEEVAATGKKGKKGGLTDEQKADLASEIARYALFCENNRKAMKSQDLSKTILAGGKAKHFNDQLAVVNKKFKHTFGMELVLLRAKDGAGGKNPPKAYVLRSTIPVQLLREMNAFDAKLVPDATPGPEDNSNNRILTEVSNWRREKGYMRDIQKENGGAYGLMGVILGLILVSGKVLGDDQLVSYLKRLSIHPDTIVPTTISSSHPGLTLTAFLNLLVKQNYLERLKSNAGGAATQAAQGQKGDATVQWKWGARAEAEIGELGVARFLKTIYESKEAAEDVVDDDEEGAPAAPRRRKGNTGEKLMNEITRAAGEGQLQDALDNKGL